MPTRYVKRSATLDGGESQKAQANTIRVDSDTNVLKFGTGASGTTEKEVVDTESAQALANKTGVVLAKAVRLTENGSGTSYVGTIPIPAGATLLDVQVIAEALWDGTSAALDVGDTADPNGFFAAVDLKATDLLVGEMLSAAHGDLWGGKNGAYLVAATGRRGATANNFALSYKAGSNIVATVTPGAADGSAGRTLVVAYYAVPTLIDQVAT